MLPEAISDPEGIEPVHVLEEDLPVTPQDFWPELDPRVLMERPLSDFLSQHLASLALWVQ